MIGSGSAGAVVAFRLSENKDFSILLLEAGLDEPAWTQVPSFYSNTLRTKLDWQYSFENKEAECLDENDSRCYWGRGKVFYHSFIIFLQNFFENFCNLVTSLLLCNLVTILLFWNLVYPVDCRKT